MDFVHQEQSAEVKFKKICHFVVLGDFRKTRKGYIMMSDNLVLLSHILGYT